MESWACGLLPLVPEAIRMVPASTGAASKSSSSRGSRSGGFDALQDRVERDLLHHKPAIAALAVEMVRVPLAEMIIGPLVDRVVEIVSPRIDGQLVQQFGIEPRRFKQGGIRVAEQIESLRDELRGSGPSILRRRRCTAGSAVRVRADKARFFGKSAGRRPDDSR